MFIFSKKSEYREFCSSFLTISGRVLYLFIGELMIFDDGIR